jgi:hypothetical protein
LFTNVTLWPTLIETWFGLTPLAVIVIVAPLGPGLPVEPEFTVVPPPPDGPVGESPPHAMAAANATVATNPIVACFRAVIVPPIPRP